MLLAVSGTTAVLGIVITAATATAGAVTGIYRVRGDTKEALEKSSDKRVAEAMATADHFRGAYEAARVEAVEQREAKHAALNEVSALKMATDLTSLRKDLTANFDAITTRLERVEETQRETVAALQQFEATQQKQATAMELIVVRLNGTDQQKETR